MSRVNDLNNILRSLQTATPDIEGCALISEDGLVIASALPQHVDEMRVAAMSSTLLSLGSRSASELDRGQLQQVLVKGDSGYAVMVSAAAGTLLLALTSKDAKLGLVFLDMSRACAQIQAVL